MEIENLVGGSQDDSFPEDPDGSSEDDLLLQEGYSVNPPIELNLGATATALSIDSSLAQDNNFSTNQETSQTVVAAPRRRPLMPKGKFNLRERRLKFYFYGEDETTITQLYTRGEFEALEPELKALQIVGFTETFRQPDEHYWKYMGRMIMGEAAKQDKRTQKAIRLLMDSLSSQGYIEVNGSRYQLTDLGRDRLIQNYKDLNASSKLRAKVKAKAEATTEESITVINPNHDLDNKPADKVELLPYNKRRVAILSLVEKHNSGLIRYTNEDPLEFLKDLSDDSEFKMMLKVSSLEGLIKYKFLEIDRSSKTISLTDDGREFLFLAREYPRIVNTKIQASKTFRVIEYLLIKTGIPLDLKISHDSVPEFSDWLKPKNNKMSIIEGAADDLGSKANILVRRLYDLEVINQYIQRQTSRYITNVRLTKQGIMFGLYLLKMQTKRDELKRAGLDDEAEEA